MTALTLNVQIKDFPILSALKSPTLVRKKMRKHYARAAFIVGRVVTGMMRRVIRGGVAPPNSPMTIAMKGSSKPLVKSGRLAKSITHSIMGDYSQIIQVGVMRTSTEANVAIIVSRGASITVSRRMAVLFKVLHAASIGRPHKLTSAAGEQLLASAKGPILPLKEGTTLTIPPRPFAKLTLMDPKLKLLVEATYKKALMDALAEMKGGGPSA